MIKRTKRKAEAEAYEEQPDVFDNELDAEIQAVSIMREERKQKQLHSSNPTPNTSNYNREGLIQCLESMSSTAKLPFVQLLNICDVELSIEDENDDLAREVMQCKQHVITNSLLPLDCLLQSLPLGCKYWKDSLGGS